jgi:glycosyltransferase involved in cell wall biosynthesis
MWRLRQVFTDLDRDFRILALDDASSDGGVEVLEPYGRVLPLTLLRSERRKGYAASLERLLREAVRVSAYPRRDGILVMQADFTDGPEAVPELMRQFQGGADLVVARPSRPGNAPRTVRLARRGAELLTRSTQLPEGIADPVAGFRLLRLFTVKRAFEEVPEGGRLLRHDGWAANVDLLAAVAPHVRRAEEVEVETDYGRRYRESRFRAVPELWGILRAARAGRRRLAAAAGAGEAA